MTLEQFIETRNKINARMKELKQFLDKFPKGQMGLHSNEVRNIPAFKQAKNELDKLFATLQKLNKSVPKDYLKKARGR